MTGLPKGLGDLRAAHHPLSPDLAVKAHVEEGRGTGRTVSTQRIWEGALWPAQMQGLSDLP